MVDVFVAVFHTVDIHHGVPDALVSHGTNDVGWNLESSCVGEDGEIRRREAVVKQHDNAVGNIETLVIEVLPIRAFEGTRTGDIAPHVRVSQVCVMVSPGNRERRLRGSYGGSTYVLATQATEHVHEGGVVRFVRQPCAFWEWFLVIMPTEALEFGTPLSAVRGCSEVRVRYNEMVYVERKTCLSCERHTLQ